MKTIFVQFDPPPIPFRGWDWQAWVDGEEEHRSAGLGPTKERAIDELVESYELDPDEYFVVEK